MSLRDRLKSRLEEVQATTAGSATVSTTDSMTSTILDTIKDFLSLADILPSEEEVLAIAGDLFDQYIATRPALANRPFLTSMLKRGLLFAVSELYEQLT